MCVSRSTLTEPLHYADMHGIANVEPHYTIFNGLLLLLLVLHIYWTWLIFKVCGLSSCSCTVATVLWGLPGCEVRMRLHQAPPSHPT